MPHRRGCAARKSILKNFHCRFAEKRSCKHWYLAQTLVRPPAALLSCAGGCAVVCALPDADPVFRMAGASAAGAGLVIGELKMERHLEDWVAALQNSQTPAGVELPQLSWGERIEQGFHHVREIVGKVWPYILAGIALGAGIHGYVPEDFMASIMGKEAAWWSVPAAVLIGVPMYANAAGIIPVVEALMNKGAALGTVLAFMMSVIALSLPEMIILRKVLKPTLIAVFAGIVAAGILLVGYVFNALL